MDLRCPHCGHKLSLRSLNQTHICGKCHEPFDEPYNVDDDDDEFYEDDDDDSERLSYEDAMDIYLSSGCDEDYDFR